MDKTGKGLLFFQQWTVIVFAFLGIVLSVNQIFYLKLFDIIFMENTYIYGLMALFLSLVFILFPAQKEVSSVKSVFYWLDIFLFLLTIVLGIVFALKGREIIDRGWAAVAPLPFVVLSILIWFICIEAARRTGGLVLAAIVAFFSFYPLFAGYMPGFLQGNSFSFFGAAIYHAMSTESILGIPMKVFSDLLIGYILFGVALIATGGGKFFLDFASAFLGHTRGGAAKVSVLASAFFGSMSGSAISNVVTTGSITIPAMKKTGYPAYYAAAIEACASTGGVLMPPVMGTTAFIMASFLNMPYLSIAIAAAIPSILYYSGLLVQIDGHAAVNNLMGLPRDELPSITTVLKEGWYYAFSLVLIVVFLYFRLEARAPYFAIIFLFLATNIRKETRLNFGRIKDFFWRCGRLLAELVGILGAVGLIIGSLAMTGVAHSFSREIVMLAGGNLGMLLLFGALTSFILGMGMTISACYVFLAIVLAPALVQAGLNELAVHLFIVYCGMLSYITPPVCVAVYPASTIAGSDAMHTGITAMRLGSVKFIIPFFFVLNPALILQASLLPAVHATITALVGVIIIGSALEGYLVGIRTLRFNNLNWFSNFLLRATLFASGFLLAMPERWTDLIGIGLGTFIIVLILVLKKREPPINSEVFKRNLKL